MRETEGRQEEREEIKLEESNQSEQPGALDHSKVTTRLQSNSSDIGNLINFKLLFFQKSMKEVY